MSEEDKANLAAFLKSLTDPRVRFEQAPFDHPELPLKAGHLGDNGVVASDALGNGLLRIQIQPATGVAGGPAIPAFIDRLGASITVALADEASSSARIAFICDKQPKADVRVRLRSSDAAVATVMPGEVLFTPATWRETRFVDVQRVLAGSNAVVVTIQTSNARSADPEFSNLAVRDLILDFHAATPASDTGPAPRVPSVLSSGAPSEAEQESPGMPRAGRMRRGKARRRRVLTEEYSEEPQRRHGASGWLAGAGGFLLSLSALR